MTCTTTVYGSGLNGANGASLGNYGNYTFTGRVTFASTTYNGFAGLQMYIDGVSQGNDYIFYTDAYVVSTTCEPLSVPHDCINGSCKPASDHGTQGLYASLSECQLSCGSRGCSGQCVSSSDWANIEGLIDKLKHRSCG